MNWVQGQHLQNGKYIIEKELGRGGFGITYKARHTFLNYDVVIKTPNEDVKSDPDYAKYVDRFIKEGRMLAQLSNDPHPHIVRISDLFREGDTHCLVMDFIPGESLWRLVGRRGALSETEAVEYIRQIGSGLSVVHQQNLVHLDVTPPNIMVRNNGTAVLIDFGIAADMSPPSTLSRTFGNQAFAPYELRKGRRYPTVDIYCLAASLYYAVTAQCPAKSFERKYDGIELKVPKQLVPSISDGLNKAILMGMALEAQDRPQSMHQWLQLLPQEAQIQRQERAIEQPILAQKKAEYQKQQPTSTLLSKSLDQIDDLSSERGVDYTNLRDLLASGQWKEADRETLSVMLRAANRERRGYLDTMSIEQFPCKDLRTIDRLWVKYSNGCFGFSVQRCLWESGGGKPGKYDRRIYRKFGERVGWLKWENKWLRLKKEEQWLSYSEITFDLNAPQGHLPRAWAGRGENLRLMGTVLEIEFVGEGIAGCVSSLCSRVETCKL
ncbi:MAG TPA: serine/threonine-protein kinase [Coleofasciculaceae cyanobacterium]|jgi:serine/threonine-protein kinase